MVFITASPLLARNVSKLYHRVLGYLKGLLRDKEQGKTSGNKATMVAEDAKKIEEPEVSVKSDTDQLFEDEFEVVGEDSPTLGREFSTEETVKRHEEGMKIVNEALENFDMKILDEAEKEIEQMMEDINLDDDRSEVPNSFYKVGIDGFPLFLTLREFLYLMDSLMGTSFFVRNIESIIRAGIKKTTGKKGYFRQKENSAGNRLYDNILYRDYETKKEDIELSSDDDEGHQFVRSDADNGQDIGPLLLSDTQIVKNEDLVTEVDYEDFRDIFYPEFLEKLKAKKTVYNKIPIQMIWQKIRNMDLQHMTQYEIKSEEGKLYFEVYQAYKAWKEKTGNYDINDLFMHLNVFYENDFAANNLIDFLFIDEIQDIPIHLLNYLKRFGTKFFYFSGDNAQNISKGVSFKFRDLATQYNSSRFRKLDTNFHALTVNYRSHQQILELGNNIVLLIKMLFPNMIEYLPPEESPITGARPMLIPLGQKVDSLIEFMKKNMGLVDDPEDSLKEDKKNSFKFANGQVFITRDYRSKQTLLSNFPNCIALTILEAKGMEFDDVILYNYFTDSDSHKPMLHFAKALAIDRRPVSEIKENELTKDKSVYYQKTNDGKIDKYTLTVDLTGLQSKDSLIDQNQMNEAADELKLLYVAITRARKRVLIFDQVGEFDSSKHSRNFFDNFWVDQNLAYYSNNKEAVQMFKDSAPFEKIKEKKKWIRDGIEYLEKGIFEYSELCFKAAEFERGFTLANYCKTAHQLKKDSYLLDSVESASQEEQKEIEEQRLVTKNKLRDLAGRFKTQGWLKQAIQCYSIAGDFRTCGELLKLDGQYDRAADYFIDVGQHEDAFECYKLAKDYMGMMNCLHYVKESKQILDLYQLIKEKLPSNQKGKVSAMVKRKLREMLHEYNCSLLSDELPNKKDLAITLEDIEGKKNELTESFATPDDDLNHQSKEKPKEVNSQSATEKRDLDEVNSFEEIDMDDAMSNRGSFEYVKSEIDELEKLSESFIGVSIQDQKIRTNPSLFEEIACFGEKELTFREIQIITKALTMLLEFYDEFVKKSYQSSSTQEEAIYELDMIELTESKCKNIIEFLDESGAHTLRILLEQKLGFKKHVLGLLVSYLFQTSPISMSFIKPQTSSKETWQKIDSNYNENRRLATMGFMTVLQKFDQKMLRELLSKKDVETTKDIMMIMALGYFRQLIHLLPHKDACTVLATFAEIQMLIMLKVNSNEIDLFDKEAIFTDLFIGSGVKKLAIVYAQFEDHPDILHCSLLYFSAHYLWEKKTYDLENFNEVVSTIRNPYVRRGLLLIKNLLKKNYEEAIADVLNLNSSKISLTNTLEAGYLGGILLSCFYFYLKFFSESMVLAEDFKKAHFFIKPLMNYFKEDSLLKSSRNKFVEGMMLALGVSMIDIDCSALSFLASFGLMVHRNSLFLKLTEDPETRPPSLFIYDKEPLTVADCGQEFYALPFKYVLDCLNSLCMIHQQEISKLLFTRIEDQKY
jgi:hypothetical protein